MAHDWWLSVGFSVYQSKAATSNVKSNLGEVLKESETSEGFVIHKSVTHIFLTDQAES